MSLNTNILRTSIVVPRVFKKSKIDKCKPYYGYIYITTNLINNKQYVGQHRGMISGGYKGSGTILLQAFEKYGKENFVSEPIDWAESKEELDQKEIWWIDFLGCVSGDSWYNLVEGGIGGRVLTDEQRARMSERNSGSGNPRYGKHLTPKEKLKISVALKGKMPADKNPFYGKHHSEESLQKMRGRECSPEQREYLRQINLGRPSPMKGKKLTEKQKEKLRGARPQISGKNNPNYGNYWSEEQRRALSLKKTGLNNPHCKPICRLSLDGELLEEYQMIKQAISQGYDSNGIQGCLQHRTKRGSYRGFKWVYKEEYEKGGGEK